MLNKKSSLFIGLSILASLYITLPFDALFSTTAKHCMLGDTKITMADDSVMDIADLKEGDVVLTFNPDSIKYGKAKVKKIHQVSQNRIFRVKTTNGLFIEVTTDQPFVGTLGWLSMSPRMTMLYDRYKDTDVHLLDGDVELYYYDVTSTKATNVATIDGSIRIVDTYSLELDTDEAFIANSFIVGQE